MRVLVVNTGSSSIKYKLFDMDGESVLAKGVIADIGGAARNGEPGPPQGRTYDEALDIVFRRIRSDAPPGVRLSIDAIGHRVVHGGATYSAAVLIDDAVCSAIAKHAVLAPLHNPPSLAGIEAARRRQPDVQQVAVFDTAFHQSMPPRASLYALPREIARKHDIRRYGFHGTSCAWSLGAAAAHLGRPAESLNLIVAHLGAGASVTAIRAGRSVDTSMGLSPLEGLMMQTRSGDLDPAILLQLLRSGMTVAELDHLLNFESGVLGICGEDDMLTVANRGRQGDPNAILAREMYCYRAQKYVSAYASVAWPLDALIFTGGVGENDPWVRASICSGLRHLGIELDRTANDVASPEPVRSIRAGRSGPDVLVVLADEELQIARETVTVVTAPRVRGTSGG